MANKKITDLVEITSAANVDVLPIVDVSADVTNKIKVENLPINTATQTALDAKQEIPYIQPNQAAPVIHASDDVNTGVNWTLADTLDLVAGGSSKVRINQTGVTNITVNSSTYVSGTELGYLDGVTSAIQTQLNAKQATLVSGTNIKTINSTSLLGSGDIAIAANPAGTAGQIQFSDGSAFAADSNLYWDNTNKRLGVGTSSPTKQIQVTTSTVNGGLWAEGSVSAGVYIGNLGNGETFVTNNGLFHTAFTRGGNVGIGTGSFASPNANDARLKVKGSGSTSATTSLLVQNSSATELFKVTDNGGITMGVTGINNNLNGTYTFTQNASFRGVCDSGSSALNLRFVVPGASRSLLINADYSNTNDASALVEIQSTTKGFLPPRMTTTQKNAISTPAAGLMVYDTDTNKLCCYNGTSWNDLF